jgi:lipid-binding SYLF domain-containing protein
MKNALVMVVLIFALHSSLFAQSKVDKRLANSATALQAILQGDNGLPKSVLNQAVCVLIYPGVKKVAFGIGDSYGRGELVCRKGAKMNGAWSSPAMYSLDQGSVGLQLGSTETDFVLVVMNQKGADQILSGRTKLGANAAAAAGPTGAQANTYNAQAMNVDVLTYTRSKGLFAGVSLEGATMDTDNAANRDLYGKDISAQDIVKGSGPVVSAAKPLVNLLDKTSPART